MRVFAYVLLWSVVFVLAVAVKVFLGDFLDGTEMAKALKSLIKAVPTGIFMGIGLALQGKLKVYFKK